MFKILQRYKYSTQLLRELIRTDFKLRYQDSVLGYVWSLLRPLLLFLILYVVFTKFLKVGDNVPHYPVYLLLGIVLWNYFVEVTTGSVSAIVGKGDLIRKINFPKYNIIFAGSFAALINLSFNFIVIIVFMIIGKVAIGWLALVTVPLIIELFVFAISLAFFLSALFVRFRDVSYIWDVVIQGAFYATPILYPLSRIPYHRIQEIMLLNPIAQIIQDARYSLITRHTQTIAQVYGGDKWIWLIPIGVTSLLCISGTSYFRVRSRYFAEEV